jgi:hypothetical protein
MAEVDITEQERLLTDPARSFETPTPTPDDQMREAAAAGLTVASAREVWEQTRALIMTEDFDAVSRDELLAELGPKPGEGDTVVLMTDWQEADDIEVVDTSLWFQSNDCSEYRIVLGQSRDGFRWAIDDGPRDQGGDLTGISWSGQAFGEKELALGQGMLVAREFYDLARNTSHSIDEDEGYAL